MTTIPQKAQHTPGPWATRSMEPWSVDSDDGSCSSWAIGTAHDVVAIAVTHSHYSDAEFTANAHLIAAAPEMLAAGEKLLKAADYGDPDLGMDAYDDLRAAIAKAKGGAA